MPDLAKLTVRVETEGFQKVDDDLGKLDGGFTRGEARATAFGAVMAGVKATLDLVTAAIRPFTDALAFSIRASEEQERATAKLNQTLRSSGQFSQEYSDDLAKLAGGLQRVTTYGDEVIEGVEGQLIAFGATRDQVGQLTEAVLNLSEGMGRDLQGATLVLGKALAGEFGTLSRYGIIVDENASSSEKLAQALDQIERRFGGQARAAAQNYAGVVQQVKNAFGDVGEEVGAFITTSNGVLSVYQEVSGLFLDAAGALAEYRKESEGARTSVDEFALGVLDATKVVIEWIGYIDQAVTFLQVLDSWIADKLVQGWQAFVNGTQTVIAILDTVTNGAITAFIGKLRELYDTLVWGIQFFDETFGISEKINALWEGSGVADAVREAGRAAQESGEKYDAMADAVQRARDRASGKIDIRLEVHALDQDSLTREVQASQARLAQLQRELSQQQAAATAAPLSAVDGTVALADSSSQATDAVERLSDAVALEQYRLDLLTSQQNRAAGAAHGLTEQQQAGAEAAEKAAKEAAKHEEQLRRQAEQLARAVDPAYDYAQTLREIEALKPYLAQEHYNAALRQAKDAFDDAATGADKYRQAAQAIVDGTRTPYQQVVEDLRKIKDLSERIDPKTNAPFLNAEQTRQAVASTLEEYRKLEAGADETLGNIESAVEDVGKATADAFVGLANDTRTSFTDLLRGIRDDFVRLFAEELFINPIVNSVKRAIREAKLAARTEDGVQRAAAEAGVTVPTPEAQVQQRAEQGGEGVPVPSAEQLSAPWTQAAGVVQGAWQSMVGVVQGLWQTMISGVGALFTSIFIGLFGGSSGAPSWEGFFKTIGAAAISGLISGVARGAGGLFSGTGGGSTGIPASEAGGPFSGTDGSTQIGSWSWDASLQRSVDDLGVGVGNFALSVERLRSTASEPPGATPTMEEWLGEDRGVRVRLAPPGEAWDGGAAARVEAPTAALRQEVAPSVPAGQRRRRDDEDRDDPTGREAPVHIHLPTQIIVQDLQPAQAHRTILDNMPVIEQELIRRIGRGGKLAAAVGRRKGMQ
jgi:hypothetical protein